MLDVVSADRSKLGVEKGEELVYSYGSLDGVNYDNLDSAVYGT